MTKIPNLYFIATVVSASFTRCCSSWVAFAVCGGRGEEKTHEEAMQAGSTEHTACSSSENTSQSQQLIILFPFQLLPYNTKVAYKVSRHPQHPASTLSMLRQSIAITDKLHSQYIVNDTWMTNPEEQSETDAAGNTNNVFTSASLDSSSPFFCPWKASWIDSGHRAGFDRNGEPTRNSSPC